MSNSLSLWSMHMVMDGDNCKDGECVDEKEKMIFCANILLEGARGQALTLFLRGINSLLNNLHICHDLADGLRAHNDDEE